MVGNMTNITFSVDEKMHEKMRSHPEIKWTELLRQSIEDKLEEIESRGIVTTENLRKKLGKSLINEIIGLKEEEEIKHYQSIQSMEKERLKQIIDMEQEE